MPSAIDTLKIHQLSPQTRTLTSPIVGVYFYQQIHLRRRQYINSEEAMKVIVSSFTFLFEIICLFGIAEYVEGAVTTSQSYKLQKPMRRDIQMINPIGVDNKVTIATFNALVARIDTLNANYYQLLSAVNALVPSFSPKCPPTAPSGSLVAGLYCYFVQTTPDTFSNAVAACNANKGILAEPLFPNSVSFYNSMAITFTGAIGTIGSTGSIWIGLLQPTATPASTSFAYLSNGLQVPAGSAAFGGLSPPTSTDSSAAVFVFPGTSVWLFADITATTIKNPYICQFNTVL